MVASQHGGTFGWNVVVATDFETINTARQHECNEAQQVFGNQEKDIKRHHGVGKPDKQKNLRNAELGLQQSARQNRADDHKQRIQYVVGCNDAGAVCRLAAQLNQCVHWHAVQTCKQAKQGQVHHDAPMGWLRNESGQGHDWRRWQAA